MLDSSNNQVCPSTEVEIPLGLLICDPWEARCLAQFPHFQKTHCFGCWWEMEQKANGPHVLPPLPRLPGAYEGLQVCTCPVHVPLQEERWHELTENEKQTNKKHHDRLRKRPWKEILYFNNIKRIFSCFFWPRGLTFSFCTGSCKLCCCTHL